MNDYVERFAMMAVCSFLATLILAAFDVTGWRRFRIWSRSSNEDGDCSWESSASDLNEQPKTKWWYYAIFGPLLFGLAIVLIPVALGAIPAFFIVLGIARYRWFRRAVRRLLRRRRLRYSWIASFIVAPFVGICRLVRFIKGHRTVQHI